MPYPDAPQEVVDLVERFDRNLDAYRSDAYNETRLRRRRGRRKPALCAGNPGPGNATHNVRVSAVFVFA